MKVLLFEDVNNVFERITLGLSGDINLMQARLYNHPECVFPITIFKEEGRDAVTYIECTPNEDVFLLDQYVNVVAEYVIERYETGLLRRILRDKFKMVSPAEQRAVLKHTEWLADDPEVGYAARKQCVLLSVYDYLREHSEMLMDGFVTFRLKEYEALLERFLERLIERIEIKREYEEFVGLLRYFVQIQSPRPKVLHVTVCTGGGYVLTDASGRDVTASCFADFVEEEALLTEESYDDLLISVLITLAPETILVHNKGAITNHELFSTISLVFDGAIEYCEGCHLCGVGLPC